jgi:pimeloyl-ACP methyl ester carboxylesterase
MTMTGHTIRAFEAHVPDEDLADLRRRIATTRWPPQELVADRSQGVQLATIQHLVTCWGTGYDWRACEAKLNALPQFITEIDGLGIHFIHVRSRHENALPLIITHGWPGSVIEMLEAVGPLTDPTAHGGAAEDAFDLVIPSLPGYGFSAQPTETGWDPRRIAQAWAELMRRLGYTRYVAQGGDQGAAVTDAMGGQAPEGLLGIHLNFLRQAALGNVSGLPADSEEERSALAAISTFRTSGSGYLLEQATRPQTIGYALLDSPVAQAAWMLDHDTDSYYKISRAFVHGQPEGNLTREHILDNITLYWLMGTGASAAHSYWEADRPRLTPRDRLLRRSHSRSASPRSLARSSGPRAAGSRSSTPTSSTSTRPARVVTSPPGKSPSCSRPRSGPRSSSCANIPGPP